MSTCMWVGPAKKSIWTKMEEATTFGIDDEALAGWDADSQV